MPFALPGLSNPLEAILRQRMSGQGMGYEAYDEARQAGMNDLYQGYQRQRTNAIGQNAISGTGRSGASEALLAMLGSEEANQRGMLSGQMGIEKAKGMNQGIESALGMGMTLEQMMGQRAMDQQRLDMEGQTSIWDIIGGVAGMAGGAGNLAAGLFGRNGAFPIGGRQQAAAAPGTSGGNGMRRTGVGSNYDSNSSDPYGLTGSAYGF